MGMGERIDAILTMPATALPLVGLTEGKNGTSQLNLWARSECPHLQADPPARTHPAPTHHRRTDIPLTWPSPHTAVPATIVAATPAGPGKQLPAVGRVR